jgi:TPR repeat protein
VRVPLIVAFVVGALPFGLPAAADSSPPSARAACQASSPTNPERCDKVGDLLERGDLPRRYPEEPGLYFALACEEGLARSCPRAQAWAARYPDYEALEIDVGCMIRGSGFACEEVANALREARGSGAAVADALARARSRMQRALDLHLAGCDRSDAESCLGASRVYAGGFGVAWNPREARAMEAKGCALGLGAACEAQGDHLALADAIEPYRKACEPAPGSPHACLKLARAYESAGAPASLVESSYRNACARLSFDACLWVSRSGEGLAAEARPVVDAFRRWCDSGSPRACELVNRLPPTSASAPAAPARAAGARRPRRGPR